MKITKMGKIGAAGLVAFCAASIVADRLGAGTSLAQITGFIGGFAGSLVASRRPDPDKHAREDEPPQPDSEPPPHR